MATTQVIRCERFPNLADEKLFPCLAEKKLNWWRRAETGSDSRSIRARCEVRCKSADLR
jgi:hypothetical protein